MAKPIRTEDDVRYESVLRRHRRRKLGSLAERSTMIEGTTKRRRRKPRGMKLDGTKSLDMCPYCLSFHCDSASMSRKFSEKVSHRLSRGVCPSCGQDARSIESDNYI
jgi:hypothetical protein